MIELHFAFRLAVALLCGVVIGVERQYRQRTAGLRTSALAATGSALFVLVTALTSTDSRVAAQVVSGVGFLCAGVIIRDGLTVRGLNTAGTLWCASGGQYVKKCVKSRRLVAPSMLAAS